MIYFKQIQFNDPECDTLMGYGTLLQSKTISLSGRWILAIKNSCISFSIVLTYSICALIQFLTGKEMLSNLEKQDLESPGNQMKKHRINDNMK